MKIFKKSIYLVLVSIMACQLSTANAVSYWDDTPQLSPNNLRIDEFQSSPTDYNIGYTEYDGFYADLTWDVTFPPSYGNFLNLYMQEISKPYRPAKTRILKEGSMTGDIKDLRVKELSSGTVYYFDMTAFHNHTYEGNVYQSGESAPSNRLKVLTDIAINAESMSSNQIKIEWDDVWYNGRRIDYKLYISESNSFSNTPPIYIDQQIIGPDAPVSVNTSTGKLEYIHNVADPGRVYYIKIVPDINDAGLKRSAQSATVLACSHILVKTTMISMSGNETFWRLDWTPAIDGLEGNKNVKYEIYTSTSNEDTPLQYIARVDDTTFFVSIPKGQEDNYYVIRAIITENGVEAYPGIRITSANIIVVEQPVPVQPVVPEFVDVFEKVQGDNIISYHEELKPSSATILWKTPLNGDGSVDYQLSYDIWLIEDSDMLKTPPEGSKIASSISMNAGNYVMNGSKHVGYKYQLSNLTQNSTYYFKIVAKKTALQYSDDNKVESVTLISGPAVKVVTTPSQGPISQPVVPSKPPLRIKQSLSYTAAVTDTTAIIQLKNKWFERYNLQKGIWEYVKTEKDFINDTLDYDPTVSPPDGITTRMVQYDAGVSINVGCTEYEAEMPLDDLYTIPAVWVENFPVLANDNSENPALNPDGLRHNIDIPLQNLKPNTTYVIWVRAVRNSLALFSEPSEAIVITTMPETTVIDEIPTVPVFNYGIPGDTYINLGWNITTGYYYNIKYATTDNINSASNTLKIGPENLNGLNTFKINGLDQNKLYYFWIQAEVNGQNGKINLSDWSDSIAVKTLPFYPPTVPRGFGLKSAKDSITKNSITYEWIKVNGLKYTLEISDNSEYKSSSKYELGEVSEYTVDNLRSNKRYYARLYAVDPLKVLSSVPTQSIAVRTLQSKDEYDSDFETDNSHNKEYMTLYQDISTYTFNVTITGSNAERFIERFKTDNSLDTIIDLSKAPYWVNKISLRVSGLVFKELDRSGENFIMHTSNGDYIIRPGVLTTDTNEQMSDTEYEINIIRRMSFEEPSGNLIYKADTVRQITVNVHDSRGITGLIQFKNPLKVTIPYDFISWYNSSSTFALALDSKTLAWDKLITKAEFDIYSKTGVLEFEINSPGISAVFDISNDYFDDVSRTAYKKAILNVASLLKPGNIPGRKFYPNNNIVLGDAVKFLFDVVGYEYGSDYMKIAVKSGIISIDDLSRSGAACNKAQAINMIQRVLELKTLMTPSETGFFAEEYLKHLSPEHFINRAEFMFLLDKLVKILK